MPPPRPPTPGRRALESAYFYNGPRPVAYLDETYRVERGGPTYYVMVAAVIQADQRDLVRRDVQRIVGSGYWHTSEALQTTDGAERVVNYSTTLATRRGLRLASLRMSIQFKPMTTMASVQDRPV